MNEPPERSSVSVVESNIRRFIPDDRYADKELAVSLFLKLDALLEPIYAGCSFEPAENEKNFEQLFEKAVCLISKIITDLKILEGNDMLFAGFKSDIAMFGHYASEALDYAIFRFAKTNQNRFPEIK